MSYSKSLSIVSEQISALEPVKLYGKIKAVKGIIIEALGITDFVSIGTRVLVYSNDNSKIICEVVGFDESIALSYVIWGNFWVGVGSKVEVLSDAALIYPDSTWLGRVINALAEAH
jgi:flagellum-specific ATP synthase